MEIWTLIVKSNTFNFIFLVLILGLICKFCKVGELLSKAQNKVKDDIDFSSKTKEESINELNLAKEEIKNLQNEIDDIFQKSKENIENFNQKANDELKNQEEKIQEDTQKIASSEEKKASLSLRKQTALAVFEVVKNHLQKMLEKNPKYHQNFIKESIEELDRLKY